MAKNADGEVEVLLGNKQVLSLFFIVVILLGVFFTMGYLLGRNSGAGSAASTAARKDASTATAGGFSNSYSGTDLPSAPSQAQSAPAATPVEETAAALAGRTQPQTQPPAVETGPAVQRTVAPVAPTEPASGQTYLQVIASSRDEVDLVVSVLKKKGFHSLTAPGPSEGVFRALVGPIKNAEAIAEARAGLEKAGFKPILRKY